MDDGAMFTIVDSLCQFDFPLRNCVLRSPHCYEKGHAEVTAYGKHVSEVLAGS